MPLDRAHDDFLVGSGVPQTDIAPLTGCSKGTLRKHFAWELRLGKAQANIRICEQIYKIATGDPTLAITAIAAIFWAKCHMGWRETRRADASLGPIGDAPPSSHVVVVGPKDAEPP